MATFRRRAGKRRNQHRYTVRDTPLCHSAGRKEVCPRLRELWTSLGGYLKSHHRFTAEANIANNVRGPFAYPLLYHISEAGGLPRTAWQRDKALGMVIAQKIIQKMTQIMTQTVSPLESPGFQRLKPQEKMLKGRPPERGLLLSTKLSTTRAYKGHPKLFDAVRRLDYWKKTSAIHAEWR